MSKKPLIENQEDAFEIIELAIDDIELLTRAFDVIGDVCKELGGDRVSPEAKSEPILLN